MIFPVAQQPLTERQTAAALVALAEEKRNLWGDPQAFRQEWEKRTGWWIRSVERSRLGRPCVVIDLGSDEPHPLYLVSREAGILRAQILPQQGIVSPNPPVWIGDHLTIAGMGSTGAMRLSPILQMWRLSSGRWKLVQSDLKEMFSGNAYWASPNHFVMERPVSTMINEGEHPNASRRRRIEHWKYREGRFRRVASYWLDNEFLTAERFLLALLTGSRQAATRYSSPALVQAALRLRLNEGVGRVYDMPHGHIDVYPSGSYTQLPPCRIVVKRVSGRWRVVQLIPNCKAPDTWWAFGRQPNRHLLKIPKSSP